MRDDVRVRSVYGEHNATMTNDDVMVFSNVFTKTNYLPSGLAKMFPKLERFYVASSRLKHINRKNFVGFSGLKTLDLRYNEIESIPSDAFVDLFNLEVLTISGNLIKKLPTNAFVSMMDLRYFDASDNELKEFDDEVFSMNLQLEEILLENNNIKSISADFEKFSKIGFIDLRDNACLSSFYLRDHPDYLSFSDFQLGLENNCTKAAPRKRLPNGSKVEHSVLQWDMCPRLGAPHSSNMLCLIERKFMGKG
jgi:Leucine-rich repeat (LRR) protein